MRRLFLLAAFLCLFSALLSLILGGSPLKISQISSIFSSEPSPEQRIFWYVRFPRTVACLLTGCALSVAGAVIQAVLNNKLASPSILGVNSGAGLAVTLCTALGIYGGWRMALCSFLGAFCTVLLLSLGAKKWGFSRGTVILTGVALNSLLGAMTQTIITFFPDVGTMSNDFRVGDFSSVTYQKLFPAAILIFIVLALLFTLTNELDLLTLGEETARGLGLAVGKTRILFLLFVALLAGCAVSLAGLVSFVGLLVPHAVRKIAGGSARNLLPLCAMFGAGFVTLCDLIARTAFSPYEIPVGILLAFLGAPFFFCILIRRNGGTKND